MATDDALVFQLETSASALPARLTGIRRDRAAALRARAGEARRSLLTLGPAAIACFGLAYASYRYGGELPGDWDEAAYMAGMFAALIGLLPAGLFIGELGHLRAHDPHGPYLDRLRDWLLALQPDLHPRVPLTIALDLRPGTDTPPYRSATSPYSGAAKSWHRPVRLAIRLALADGTRLAFTAGERVKRKAGTVIASEGQLRGRLERPGRLPELPGWQTARDGDALLFWKKTTGSEELPDVVAWLKGP